MGKKKSDRAESGVMTMIGTKVIVIKTKKLTAALGRGQPGKGSNQKKNEWDRRRDGSEGRGKKGEKKRNKKQGHKQAGRQDHNLKLKK